MAQWLSGLWCWIYHVCLGFKSFEWQNILHLDCHGLDWIPFEILRSKNKGWIDPKGLTFPRRDHVCLGFKSFEWQNILHLDCHGLDWIPFEILRSKNKGWIDPMGLTFPRMD